MQFDSVFGGLMHVASMHFMDDRTAASARCMESAASSGAADENPVGSVSVTDR